MWGVEGARATHPPILPTLTPTTQKPPPIPTPNRADFVRGFSEWAILSRERVWYDAEGIKELSKVIFLVCHFAWMLVCCGCHWCLASSACLDWNGRAPLSLFSHTNPTTPLLTIKPINDKTVPALGLPQGLLVRAGGGPAGVRVAGGKWCMGMCMGMKDGRVVVDTCAPRPPFLPIPHPPTNQSTNQHHHINNHQTGVPRPLGPPPHGPSRLPHHRPLLGAHARQVPRPVVPPHVGRGYVCASVCICMCTYVLNFTCVCSCMCISNVFLPPASPSSLSPSLSLTTNAIQPTKPKQTKTSQRQGSTAARRMRRHTPTRCTSTSGTNASSPRCVCLKKKGDQSVLSCFVAARMGKLWGGKRVGRGSGIPYLHTTQK